MPTVRCTVPKFTYFQMFNYLTAVIVICLLLVLLAAALHAWYWPRKLDKAMRKQNRSLKSSAYISSSGNKVAANRSGGGPKSPAPTAAAEQQQPQPKGGRRKIFLPNDDHSDEDLFVSPRKEMDEQHEGDIGDNWTRRDELELNFKKAFKRRAISAVTVIGSLMHLNYSTTALRGMHCVEDVRSQGESSGTVLKVDMVTACWGGIHLSNGILILIMFVLFSVLFPFMLIKQTTNCDSV